MSEHCHAFEGPSLEAGFGRFQVDEKRSRLPHVAGAVLALVGVLAALPASNPPLRDDAVPLTLAWTAPDGCPDAEGVRQQVFEMVHASGTNGGRARYEPIDARGTVRRNGDGTWNLELETSVGGLTGTRTLSSRSCEDLARAGALVLALTINAAPSDVGAPPPPPPAKPEPIPETVSTPVASRAAPPVRFAAAIDALLSAGQLPQVGEGAGLRVEAELGHFLLQVHGAAWLPQQRTIPTDSTVGGRFDLRDVGAAACGLAGLRYGLAVELCVGAGAAWMQGTGFGTASATQSADWWAVATGSAGLRYRIAPRFALRLAAEAWTFPFGRPSFALHETGSVFGVAAVSGRIALGLQFYL